MCSESSVQSTITCMRKLIILSTVLNLVCQVEKLREAATHVLKLTFSSINTSIEQSRNLIFSQNLMNMKLEIN